MKSCLVLWEAPHRNKMGRLEFQLLYVSPAHLLVLPLMSSKPANREEEEEPWRWQRQRPALGQTAGRTGPLSSTELQSPPWLCPAEQWHPALGFQWWNWYPAQGDMLEPLGTRGLRVC